MAAACALFPWFAVGMAVGISTIWDDGVMSGTVILGALYYLVLVGPPLLFSWRYFFKR